MRIKSTILSKVLENSTASFSLLGCSVGSSLLTLPCSLLSFMLLSTFISNLLTICKVYVCLVSAVYVMADLISDFYVILLSNYTCYFQIVMKNLFKLISILTQPMFNGRKLSFNPDVFNFIGIITHYSRKALLCKHYHFNLHNQEMFLTSISVSLGIIEKTLENSH